MSTVILCFVLCSLPCTASRLTFEEALAERKRVDGIWLISAIMQFHWLFTYDWSELHLSPIIAAIYSTEIDLENRFPHRLSVRNTRHAKLIREITDFLKERYLHALGTTRRTALITAFCKHFRDPPCTALEATLLHEALWVRMTRDMTFAHSRALYDLIEAHTHIQHPNGNWCRSARA